MLRFCSVLACLFLLPPSAEAGSRESSGLARLGARAVYYAHRPAAPGQPTLLLLNGLTYSLSNWDAFVRELSERNPGLGLLRFDMIGMGRTLLEGRLPVDYEIPYREQADLAADLLDHLRIRKAFVAGLSYGGAIAVAFGRHHPEKLEQLVLMAPFTEPLRAMDQLIRNQIAATRISFPLNPASDDELYDFFLRQFIYSTYPPLEPSVLENPYKLEAIFRMVQGVRKYDTLLDARRLPAGSVHLVVADQDQYIAKDVHDRFWAAVPRAARASRIDISIVSHKIPEAIPSFSAAWVQEILSRRPELNRGLSFQGHTLQGKADSGKISIPLR